MTKHLIGLCIAQCTFLLGLTLGVAPTAPPVIAVAETLAPAPAEKEAPAAEPRVDGDPEYIYAWYRPMNNGRLWHNEVYFISLNIDPNEDGKGLKIYADVMTNLYNDVDRDEASGTQIKLDGDKLSFRTAAVKGISYRFAGTFVNGRKSGVEGERLLRGTLSRYKNGRPAGRYQGDFTYSEPVCMH